MLYVKSVSQGLIWQILNLGESTHRYLILNAIEIAISCSLTNAVKSTD
jgi:hypothetical protein